MTNEELKAKIEAVKSFDDAYKLACEGGYKGTAEEFAALVKNAADEIMPMDLDAMDSVAGGGLGDTLSNGWNAVTNACSKAANWVKENPALTAEIAGGVAMIGVAVGTSVYAYKQSQLRAAHNAELMSRDAGNSPFWGNVKVEHTGNFEDDTWISVSNFMSTGPWAK